MGIPLLLPALFGLGSLAANTIGNNQASDAIATATRLERKRQSKWDDEAFAINQRAADRFEDFEDQQSETSSELADYFKDAAATEPPAEHAKPVSDSNLVVNADAKASETARQKSNTRADALGGLRSLGTLLGNFNRLGQRDASDLNLIGSFKRGSSGILPAELAAAQQEGSGLRTLGDLLSIGSGLTMPGALAAGGVAGAPSWLTSIAPAKTGAAAAAGGYTGPLLPALY